MTIFLTQISLHSSLMTDATQVPDIYRIEAVLLESQQVSMQHRITQELTLSNQPYP